MKESTLGVALVKKACPLCGVLSDGPIVMNSILSEERAKEVKALNGKTIGYSEEPCKECKSVMEQAFLIIGIVEAKTNDNSNPYRSGNQWGIRKEKALEMFGEENCKKGACFMDVHIADKIGLPDANFDA